MADAVKVLEEAKKKVLDPEIKICQLIQPSTNLNRKGRKTKERHKEERKARKRKWRIRKEEKILKIRRETNRSWKEEKKVNIACSFCD